MVIKYIKRLRIYQLINADGIVIKGSENKQELIDYYNQLVISKTFA